MGVGVAAEGEDVILKEAAEGADRTTEGGEVEAVMGGSHSTAGKSGHQPVHGQRKMCHNAFWITHLGQMIDFMEAMPTFGKNPCIQGEMIG